MERQILEEQLKTWFTWFHRHPELSNEEFNTTEKIREILAGAGLDISLAGSGLETGLIATVCGAQPGPVQLMRCDIDALPIEEKSGLSYCSECRGKMHACGHDLHITAGIGTALLLASERERLKGEVRIVFQPAEESSQGGIELLAANPGVLDGAKQVWGLHSDPTNAAGVLGIRAGAVAGAVDRFEIVVSGTGCHAARPENGIDPIPAAAAMVLALQTIVSRNINPFHPALLSVTRFTAGNTWNVTPRQAELEGTIRTMEAEDRALYRRRVEEVAEQTALAYGARAEVRWQPGPPAVVNDAGMAALAERIGREMGFGVVPEEQTMTGDDFSLYAQQIPGCYIKVGTGKGPAIHQPGFKIDTSVLLPTAEYFAKLLLAGA